jgi:prophage antirepressor-like protein
MANQMIEIEDENKLYSFNNIQLSIIGTFEEPWFVGEEICTLLGYSNTKKALQKHIQDCEKISVKELREKIQESRGPTLGPLSNLKKLNWQKVLISEFGLYELIFNSHMPIAREFKDWVKSVLKEIRLKGKYELQKQLTEVESKLTETKRDIESKSEEIVELTAERAELNNRRFLDKRKIHIKLSDRIIALGYLSSIQKNYLFRKREVEVSGRKCKIVHPDIHKVEGKILQLSNQLSSVYKTKYKKNPDIEKSNRSNLYTFSFYEEYGDEIIQNFFKKDALVNWGIDWSWKATDDEQCPEFNHPTLE